MFMKKKNFLFLMLGLVVIGCTGNIPPNALKDSVIEKNTFSTQALSAGYLKRKFNYLIVNDSGALLVKELNYARFKHPASVKTITFNDSLILNGILDNTSVQQRMSEDSSFAAFIESLSPAVIPEGDLAAYFPFNGNANDESNNGNNGTVTNAVLTEDRFGNPDSAYSFNGTDSWIELPDNDSLDVGTGDFSIAAWIKTTNATNNGRIFSKGSSQCVPGYMMRLGDDSIWIEAGGSGGGCVTAGPGNVTVTDGQWHFVTWVAKRATNSSIYIDGLLENVIEQDTSSNDFSNDRNPKIGYNDVGNVPEAFDGVIDDMRVYRKALTQEEVTALFNENI
jgi:hypothetical protein